MTYFFYWNGIRNVEGGLRLQFILNLEAEKLETEVPQISQPVTILKQRATTIN